MKHHENVVCFDVDDTLILWGRLLNNDEPTTEMLCPYTGVTEKGQTHLEHVERIKQHKADGHFVIVWSQGGGEYAYNACVGLGILEYVDLCLDKPMQYYDDLDCSKWMGRSTYLGSIQYGHRESPSVYKVRTDYVSSWDDKSL